MKTNLKLLCYVGINILIVFSTLTIAYSANDIYEKKAQLICNDSKINVVTICSDDTYSFPFCTEQTFTFINQITMDRTTIPASGKPYDEIDIHGNKIGRWLDGLATSWQCVKGKSQSYILIGYNNGGNCDECEWVELMDLNGKNIATTKGKKNKKTFDKKMKSIGIISTSTDADIPIRKNEKL